MAIPGRKQLTKDIMDINQANQPAITFLNMTGDITLTWDKDSETSILALVEAKMAQGYSFFVLEPRKLGFIPLPARRTALTDIAQARKAGKVSMTESAVEQGLARAKLDDPDLEKLVAEGRARLSAVSNHDGRPTVSRARRALQVLTQQTVAVRPVTGG
jgi:hypothetical protein